MMSPIIIIGGGFAGLAAAVDLAEQGQRVLLLERRSFLGGRAYSLRDKITGDTVDNGQHLMMGCYHHTLNFLNKIGASDKLKFQPSPRVDFIHPTLGQVSFICPDLPAPLHLLAGLSRLKTLSWADRLKALRVGLSLKFMNGSRQRLANISVKQWLDELGQSEQIQANFWNPMALATLNERPEIASADMFAEVIEQAFMRKKSDSTMVVSRVGLSELYTEDATKFIEAHGGEVRLNASVKNIEIENGAIKSVLLSNDERLEAVTVISSVPYFILKEMLDEVLIDEHFPAVKNFVSAPIVSINLWYENPVTDVEFVGLLDSPIEWVFNKNAIGGAPNSGLQHLALVISGAHEAAKMTKESLVELAVAEINKHFPNAKKQSFVHSYVIKEQHATISHTVGIAAQRPSQQTGINGFYLAGDWTATGLPATIESAVMSGQRCAEYVQSSRFSV